MTVVASTEVQLTVGVDTPADVHVAAALDQLGRVLATHSVATTPAGCRALVAWASGLGAVERFGIEGTGSYGAGLARWLRARGFAVLEVERPKRQNRRRRGKSDAIDAEAAARAVQAGTATAQPKAGDGPIEMLRILQAARRSAIKARTQAVNQMHALVVTAPDSLRTRLRGLSRPRLVATATAFRPRLPLTSTIATTQLALKSLAVRHQQLTAEIETLEAQLELLVAQAAPDLAEKPD
jgi:transposase